MGAAIVFNPTATPAGQQNNANQLLLNTGVSYAMATMAIPFMFMTPNNTDPGMSPVQTIVRAIQTVLNKRVGAGLTVDGIMGAKASTVLRAVIPKNVTDLGTTQWYTLLQYAAAATSTSGGTPLPPAAANTGIVNLAALQPSSAGLFGGGDIMETLKNPWVIGGAIGLLYLATRGSKRKR